MITRVVAAEINELPFMMVAQLVNRFLSLSVTEGSLPCSQKPATGPIAAQRSSGEADPLESPGKCHGFHGEALLTAPNVRTQSATQTLLITFIRPAVRSARAS